MNSEQPEWIQQISDSELQRITHKNLPTKVLGDFDNLIRAAFVCLERRIRETAGLSEHEFGTKLIDKAFHPQNGILQPVSPAPAERIGLHHLLLGIFLYYRNPVAHRPIEFTEELTRPLLLLIDHALLLVNAAARAAIDLGEFIGEHEGEIIRRHDFRLDIDGDGMQEFVILLELGPSLDNGDLCPHLVPVILKKSESGYRRIPTESVKGTSLHGYGTVKVRNITSGKIPDVIVSWAWGETQMLVLILQEHEGRYVLVQREIATGTTEPYNGPIEDGFLVHMRQELSFSDIDGDGLSEMIQTLGFDRDELVSLGYDRWDLGDGEYSLVCRVHKWNADKQCIVQIDERLIVRHY